jgi:hypothetical protein
MVLDNALIVFCDSFRLGLPPEVVAHSRFADRPKDFRPYLIRD